jgi:hypothetical protein
MVDQKTIQHYEINGRQLNGEIQSVDVVGVGPSSTTQIEKIKDRQKKNSGSHPLSGIMKKNSHM